MGRYAELEFLREEEVPEHPGDLIAREDWVGRMAAAVLLLVLGCTVPVFLAIVALDGLPHDWRVEVSFDSLVGLMVSGVAGLIALVIFLACLFGGFAFLTTALAALKPGNWVLHAATEGLYIKLRAFTEHRLPRDDAIVAFIPRREVRWLRGHDQRARTVGRGGDVTSSEDDALTKQAYLEIALYDDDLSAFTERLDRERTLWCPTWLKAVRQKAKGAAVGVRPEGVIRIDWRTKGMRLRPNLSEALAYLARAYPQASELETEQEQAKYLDRAAQEQRLLDMVRQGNVTDAVIVAKSLYGFSTTEAKQFLDELEGS